MEKIEISHRTIIFTILTLVSLWFLYQVRQVIVLLFVSLIFATALNPIVKKLEEIKIPRPLAIIILYSILAGGLVAVIVLTVPILTRQTIALFEDLPQFLSKIGFFELNFRLGDYSQQISKLPANLFKVIGSTFSNLLGIFTFLVITFYILMERKNLKKYLQFLFADEDRIKAEKLVLALEEKLGGWIRGELFLMFIVGLMCYIGLKLLDLDFVFPLALIAGFLEIIPNIGPTIAMIPAVIVGFASSPFIGLAVVVLYILVQQLENNLIVPKVMQKTIGLHPLLTLTALIIGFKISGIGGGFLAIPTVLFIKVIIEQFFSSKRKSLGNP